ncbi:MAG: cytochrome c3 family protein [Armatimonadota bacterium]
MLKNIVIGIAVCALAISAGTVMAGDYHSGATLQCAECHTMHYSISHTFGDGHSGDTTLTQAGGPYVGLLKADVNSLCMQCHDDQAFAPDVSGANTGTHVREAGGLSTGAAPYEDWKGHTLGYSGAIPGGGTMAAPLECTSCHAQHGQASGATYPVGYTNGQWRNLVTKPNGSTTPIPVTFAKGVNDPTLAIYEHDATLGQVNVHYSADNVDFNEPDATKSAYGEWCQSCHTNFHGATNEGSALNWSRHPTAGVNVGTPGKTYYSSLAQYKGHTNKVKTLVSTTADDFTPSCFSCHKAHGNQNAFGLIYMQGTGTPTEQGDDGTQVKDLCRQCHVQGA